MLKCILNTAEICLCHNHFNQDRSNAALPERITAPPLVPSGVIPARLEDAYLDSTETDSHSPDSTPMFPRWDELRA